MFPWSPEFVWDVPHVLFFGALYSVVATIAATLAVAACARGATRGRAAPRPLRWHADFEDLPASARACRHQLTGEAPGRTCESGFDCRRCREHRRFVAARQAADAARRAAAAASASRCRPTASTTAATRGPGREADGTSSSGVDELGARLVGPGRARSCCRAPGRGVHANGPLASVARAAHEARLLSPVDGDRGRGPARGRPVLTLRVDPGPVLDLRHLLSGEEARVVGAARARAAPGGVRGRSRRGARRRRRAGRRRGRGRAGRARSTLCSARCSSSPEAGTTSGVTGRRSRATATGPGAVPGGSSSTRRRSIGLIARTVAAGYG